MTTAIFVDARHLLRLPSPGQRQKHLNTASAPHQVLASGCEGRTSQRGPFCASSRTPGTNTRGSGAAA